ncbi:GCN5 family acetyltransferase [Haematococcus lacustris]|uniref:GCN5 family acetyltransferase n=1 Tax=Haematococcus lacustris TaxID=44745 RepID=A0A699YYZ4_HAELA|nr:GCN5 family acetyltransferase [Haematococcus lacustris]
MNPLGLDAARFVVADTPDQPPSTSAPSAPPLLGFAQLEQKGPRPSGREWELRSLVVVPQARRRGIGSRLVAALLARVSPGDRVVLTTLAETQPFYQRCSFCVMPPHEVPRYLTLEMAVGNMLAPLVRPGQQLVAMHWTSP